MAVKHVLMDGQKSISLSQYPDEAWVNLSPNVAATGDSRGNAEAIQNYYETGAWLFHCVEIRANSILQVPWAIVQGETDVWLSKDPEPPKQLDFLGDIERLLWLTEAALCLVPETFWFRERNRVRTLALRWHAPSSVIPQWSESEGLAGFKRMLGNGQARTFGVEDYVYLPRLNPFHETLPGRPPGQAAMSAAGVLYNVDAFAAAFFERGAIKATVLTIDGNPQPNEILKLEAWWKRFFSGVKSAWQTAAVRAGVTPVVVGEGMESLSQNTLTGEKKEDIAAALGIPASVAWSGNAGGLGGGGVSVQDELHLYDKTVIPEFKAIARSINKQLLNPMGYALQPRHEEMSIYQEDEEQRSQSVQHLTSAGLDVDLAMEILGYDLTDDQWARLKKKIEEKPITVQPMGNQDEETIPFDGTVEESKPAELVSPAKAAELARFRRWLKKRPNADLSDFDTDVLSEADKEAEVSAGAGFFTQVPDIWTGKAIPDGPTSIAAWKAILQLDPGGDDEAEQKARMGVEQQAEDEIATALEKQRKALIPANSPPTSAEAVVQRVEATSSPVRDALRRALIASSDLGVSVAVSQFENIGFGFDWTLANTSARDWANRYTGELITKINDTTRQQVRQAVGQWVDNGDPLPVLVRELSSTFGRQRAGLIASTEVTRAYTQGNLEAWKEAGYGEGTPDVESPLHPRCRCWLTIRINGDNSADFIFNTSRDERVCSLCGPYHGKAVGVAKRAPVVPVIGRSEPTLQAVLREEENKIFQNQKYETAVLVDSEGNILIKKDGKATSVSFGRSELNLFDGNILTHNHPGPAISFSGDDLSIAAKNKLKEIRAVAIYQNTKYTYQMEVLDPDFYRIKGESIKSEWTRRTKLVAKPYWPQYRAGEITKDEIDNLVIHEVVGQIEEWANKKAKKPVIKYTVTKENL